MITIYPLKMYKSQRAFVLNFILFFCKLTIFIVSKKSHSMSIKTFFTVISIILLASSTNSFSVEVLIQHDGVRRARTDSWSDREDVIKAIEAYRSEVQKCEDVFTTGEAVWRSMPDISESQPFIGDKREGEEGFVDNASNRRFTHIQDVQKYVKRLHCGIELLDNVKAREKDIGALSVEKCESLAFFLKSIHLIDGRPIVECLYRKVNGDSGKCNNGMRAYGLSFSRVTKPEWSDENALMRLEKVIGTPSAKGSLQMALDRLLWTIKSHATHENHI